MIQAVAVVGPTASGKSALGLALAERLGTEVVSADSMQVYRGMEIGTAAPSPEERARVPHHFVSFLDPSEQFSAGAFEALARPLVDALNTRGKPAIIVGGSGLYVRALIDSLFSGPARDASVRERLHGEAEELGVAALFARLKEVDPHYAEVILPGDLRRIVRALEVYELTGAPISELHAMHQEDLQPLDALQVALEYPREQLYACIDARVDRMLEQGFLDELQRLLDKGYGPHLERLRSLGYREFMRYLAGECTFDEARAAMQQSTRRLAKRQLSWFRGDPRIRWIPATTDEPPEAHVDAVLAMMAQVVDGGGNRA